MQIKDYIEKSVQDFTIDLYKEVVSKKDNNLVVSALSVHAVLAMAAAGAQGSTAKELKKCLRLRPSIKLGSGTFFLTNAKKINKDYSVLIHTLQNVPDVILKLANKIYISDLIRITDEFKKLTSTYFQSESESIDFSKVEEAVKIVNQWASVSTNQRIKELLNEVDVNSNTAMILLNTLYFKSQWMNQFNPSDTKLKLFYLNKTDTITVPTMYIQEQLIYGEISGLDASFVKLEFRNPAAYMIIVIPEKIDGLEEIEKNLDKVFGLKSTGYLFFETPRRGTVRADVSLSLPKFKIETTLELNNHLKELGLREIFTEKANFTGISDQGLIVDKVLQKVFIEVNEEGCEASAEAHCLEEFVDEKKRLTVNVNRPFIYAIIYKKITLFLGRVVDPLA